MSGGERGVTIQSIQRVQHLIEQCIQSHMNRVEVVNYLQSEVEPRVTELVWQKLEEENREFFEAYNLRLVLKQQIHTFNELLLKQAQLMHEILSPGVPLLISNGSHMTQFQQNPGCSAVCLPAPQLKPECFDNSLASHIASPFSNGVSLQEENHQAAIHMSASAGSIDALPNTIFGESTNTRMMQGTNGGMVKSENGYQPRSQYIFAADDNVLEARPTTGDASVASFGNMDSNPQPLNDALLDMDASSYVLERNFRFSSTPTYCESVVGGYSGSPYLATEAGYVYDSHQAEIQLQEDSNALDTISEGFSYDVGSE